MTEPVSAYAATSAAWSTTDVERAVVVDVDREDGAEVLVAEDLIGGVGAFQHRRGDEVALGVVDLPPVRNDTEGRDRARSNAPACLASARASMTAPPNSDRSSPTSPNDKDRAADTSSSLTPDSHSDRGM